MIDLLIGHPGTPGDDGIWVNSDEIGDALVVAGVINQDPKKQELTARKR
jgi:hypothetical protein